MALIVATDAAAAAHATPKLLADIGSAVLLCEPGHHDGEIEALLRPALPEMAVVEVGSPRFARLNFGALSLVAVDLSPALLDSPPGRRLFDALGGLMREGLSLLFAGASAGMVGSLLAPAPNDAGADPAETDDLSAAPLRAGLGLLPDALVLPALPPPNSLRPLLARLNHAKGRLLALDGSVAVRCSVEGAAPIFTLHSAQPGGSALLVAFAPAASADQPPVARLHPLSDGQSAGWPA